MRISSSLLSAAFFAGGFFGGGCGFVLPDALRAVVVVLALGAGLAAALDDSAGAGVGFFSKKSVIEGCAVGFVFLASLIYASLSSSLSTLLQGETKGGKERQVNTYYKVEGGRQQDLLTTCVYWIGIGQPCLCPFPAPLARGHPRSPNPGPPS